MVVETQEQEQVEEQVEDIETSLEAESVESNDETNVDLENEDKEHQEGAVEEAEDEVEISLGEESLTSEKEEAPSWVKELRKQNKEQSKKLKEYEQMLAEKVQEKSGLGEKPTLEAFEYDEEKYEKALGSYYEKKREFDLQAQERQAEEQKAVDAWNAKLQSYQDAKTELKVKDFEEVESEVMNALDDSKQGIIVEVAKNPALVVYAIGKNPKRAAELSKISNPLEFVREITLLERDLKVTKKVAKPAPEKTVQSTGGKSGTLDTQLEKLRAEAEKTGDVSKVMAYKRKIKNQN